MSNVKSIGFTATHGLKHAKRGPFFLWLDGKCSNALTVNSWWHQNFILEYADYYKEEVDDATDKNPDKDK